MFLKGINVHAPESRDHADELIEFLQGTPIEWVRIHPLPSRRIRAKNRAGVSYLDAIDKFAKAGFNLVLPIDVGVRDNVGIVTEAGLRKFVDESYAESYNAVKHIETRLSSRGRVIYGAENEIDTKEWILQSMPTVRWRETTLSWISLSLNRSLKYKRLGNILDGIKDASPRAKTMVNFEADDPRDDWTSLMSFLVSSYSVFSKLGLLDRLAVMRMNNYRVDIMEAMRRLSVDIIGLDNYPNYFTKFPPRGQEIGMKVDEIASRTSKPVMNVEFGYSAREVSFFSHLLKRDPVNSSGAEAQGNFFKNALASIENSKSEGTFPWVLYLDPARAYRPSAENGFTLLARGYSKRFEPMPSLEYYLNWLGKGVEIENSQEAHVKTK
ncbi:MAG: hypothetical protein ACYC7D_09490 [Nitrososphaerales archaeon]